MYMKKLLKIMSNFFNYIQAPSMIINKINNTKTIAEPDVQLAINTFLLFCLFTLFYGKN